MLLEIRSLKNALFQNDLNRDFDMRNEKKKEIDARLRVSRATG